MKKFTHGWLLKFILAAILLGVGIYMYFDEKVVFLITGVFIVIFSLFRVVPLLKTLDKEVLRTINLIEIIADIIIGGVLIYVAVTNKIEDSNVWKSVYKYGLAFFFYARALVFFNSTVFFDEKTDVLKFWGHILSITVGTIIAVSKDFSPETVSMLILIISLLGSLYLGYDGYKGYNNYRNNLKKPEDAITKGKDERTNKEIEDDLNTIIDKNEDRPRVN